MMKQVWVLAGAFIAGSCSQIPSGASGNLARSQPATAVANFPSQCEIAPTFPAIPKPTSTPPNALPSGKGEYIGWEVASSDLVLQAHCVCVPDVNPAFQSEYASLAAFTKDAEARNATLENFRFESAFGAKVGRATFDLPKTPYGPARGIAHTYYLNRCTVSLSGLFRSPNPEMERQTNLFLNSVRQMGQTISPEVQPGSGPRDAASRLVRLRDLLDKGLITQKEFEERRNEVLKSL
jgi:hypothetical protein